MYSLRPKIWLRLDFLKVKLFQNLTMNNEIIINANNIKMISVDLLWNELSNYVIFSIRNKLF
jgi:NADH:ubiquinone oxidoreductase subunit K